MQPVQLTHRVGIIDLGSNSARLIVVQFRPGEVYRIADELSRRVRLSEGMAADGRLRPPAMARAIETVRMFRAHCEAHDIKRIVPVATAAVRDAANQADFLRRMWDATRLRFRVLTGEEEAYYGVLGVINSLGVTNGLVMDVGGGSAEISRVRHNRFARGETTPLGAVRLTETFFENSDRPVKSGEMERLVAHVDATWEDFDWMALNPSDTFVGLGGTVRALARIDREARQYPFGLLHGYELELKRLNHLIERMAELAPDDRARKITGLQSDRADIILAGAQVVARAMRRAGASRLTVCGQGLREGMFFQEFLQPAYPPIIPRLREFSVYNLGRLHGFEETHAAQVTRLALMLFDQLAGEHGYGAEERACLWAAGQLHDIGTVVDYYDHHKHSAYIILSAGLPGYSHREIAMIAALCYNHRKGRPDLEHFRASPQKADLDRLCRLSALLRLAEYLDRGRTGAVARVRFTEEGRKTLRLAVRVRPDADARVEIWEAQRNADLFEAAYDRKLDIEPA
jgi:exopolyphosphatase/guanosine-5'-triphosphate,3'-diphosphate pyrophosphatase